MAPNIMKWLVVVGCVALVAVAAPASLDESTMKGAQTTTESQSREGLTKPNRDVRATEDAQPFAPKPTTTSTTSIKKIEDKKRDTEAEDSSEESDSEEDLTPDPTKGSEQVKKEATENTKKDTKPKRAAESESGSSEDFYLPDSPARTYRDTVLQQPAVLKSLATSTTATATEKYQKRATDDSQKPDDNTQKPTALGSDTQSKPAVSPPLISTLPAQRPSRDVEGLYQADRFPTIAVPTGTSATQQPRDKRDVETSERKVDAKNNPALKRTLSTIPEESHEHTKRSARAPHIEYGRPQFGGPGSYRPGGPGNYKPQPGGPGNYRPQPGGPGNYRPQPGGPGNYRPQPGGPGSYRPGSGRH